MRRWMTTMMGLMAVGALTLAACGDGPKACTEIGCSDMLSVQIVPAGDEFEVGTYEITLVEDGGQPETCELVITDECGGADVCVSSETTCDGLVPSGDGTPYTITTGVVDEISVEVERDGTVLADETFEPDYEEVQPNGEGCPPTCEQGTVEVQL